MTMMDKSEFGQLTSALKETRDFIKSIISQRNDALERGEKLRAHILQGFLRDARNVASMASQALDNEEMSIAQNIALKATLAQLEYELKHLQEHARGR